MAFGIGPQRHRRLTGTRVTQVEDDGVLAGVFKTDLLVGVGLEFLEEVDLYLVDLYLKVLIIALRFYPLFDDRLTTV